MFVWNRKKVKKLYYNGKRINLAYTSNGLIFADQELGYFTIEGTPDSVSFLLGVNSNANCTMYSPNGRGDAYTETPNWQNGAAGATTIMTDDRTWKFGKRYFFTGKDSLVFLGIPGAACDLNIAGFSALESLGINDSLIPSEKISKILNDLVANGVYNGVFYRTSVNSPITGDGLTAKQTLKNRGWIFVLDGAVE